MRVITLSKGAIDWQGRELARQISEAHPDGFDLLVGVRRGGVFIADALQRHMPRGSLRNRLDVKLQRPGTAGKGARLAAVLGNTPLWMLNGARKIESGWLSFVYRHKKHPADRSSRLHADGAWPSLPDNASVLLVDDAIDTGATIFAVRNKIAEIYGADTRVTVAVITVTNDTPALDADFCMYHDRTLVRFPWSLDYKKMQP